MFQRYLTISEFCVTGSGSTPSRDSPELYQGGNIPWIKSGELRENNILKAEEHVTKLAFEKTRLKLVPKGAILVAMYGATVGRMALLGIDAATNQAICHIIPDNKIADTKYLYHCLYHKVPELLTKAVGGAQPNINQQIIKNLRIPLPPLAEQKRIARILDVAAALQAQRRATLTHLDTLLQSTFLHMFGDPVTNPMRWEEVSLSELTDIVSGVTKGRNFAGKETVMVPYMRVANVQDGELALADVKTIEVLPSDVEKYRLQKGDILLTEGGDPDKLGRGAIWEDQISSCIHQNHIFRVRVDHHRALPEYLSALIGSKRGKVYFLRAAKQTTGIATINQTQLKAFPVLLPPLILQRQYSEFVHQIKTTKSKLLQHGNHLDVLFASLQQRAFRGELSPG